MRTLRLPSLALCLLLAGVLAAPAQARKQAARFSAELDAPLLARAKRFRN